MSDTRATRDTHDRVLEAALACLVRNGYGGTTARAIAQAGGFAPGVIYYHFADLDDLLVAALERTSGARIGRYRAELAGIDGPCPPSRDCASCTRRRRDRPHRLAAGGVTRGG